MYALLALALLSCADASKLPEPKPGDLSGVYLHHSVVGDTTYRGTTILHKNGDAYVVAASSIADDGETLSTVHCHGVGSFEGGVLVVAWRSGASGVGVTKYTFDGATLKGRYVTQPGDGVTREETLTFCRKLPKEG